MLPVATAMNSVRYLRLIKSEMNPIENAPASVPISNIATDVDISYSSIS
jgi:hypothetical protein